MSEKGFSASQIPLAYSSTAIASMISPLFVGIIADRFFATQKVMAILHFLAAIFAVLVVTQDSFLPFFCFLLLHTICYMPTLALANSISLRNLEKPAEQFPLIRVFGSFGWIAAGFIISGLMFVFFSIILIINNDINNRSITNNILYISIITFYLLYYKFTIKKCFIFS